MLMKKLSKKLLLVGIIVGSLAFSQSAFAAVYEQEPNDGYSTAQVVSLYGAENIIGNNHSDEDRDWYTFTTSAADAGRTIYVVMVNTEPYGSGFVMNKNYGEGFDKTWMNFGGNTTEGLYFTAEANTRYNIVAFRQLAAAQGKNYILTISIY